MFLGRICGIIHTNIVYKYIYTRVSENHIVKKSEKIITNLYLYMCKLRYYFSNTTINILKKYLTIINLSTIASLFDFNQKCFIVKIWLRKKKKFDSLNNTYLT